MSAGGSSLRVTLPPGTHLGKRMRRAISEESSLRPGSLLIAAAAATIASLLSRFVSTSFSVAKTIAATDTGRSGSALAALLGGRSKSTAFSLLPEEGAVAAPCLAFCLFSWSMSCSTSSLVTAPWLRR